MPEVTTVDFERRIAPATLYSSLYITRLADVTIGNDPANPDVARCLEYADAIGGVATAIGFVRGDQDSEALLHANLLNMFGTETFVEKTASEMAQ